MPLVKVWNVDRSVRKAASVNTLQEVLSFAQKNFGYENCNVKVIFEADGTEIESEEVFCCLVEEKQFPGTVLQVIPHASVWVPSSTSPNYSSPSSLPSTSSSNLLMDSVDSDLGESSSTQNHSPGTFSVDSYNNTSTSANFCDFQIPWGRFSRRFLKDCTAKKRPNPSHRREVVRQVVEAVTDIIQTPPRKFLERIAKEMVEKFPESLGDSVGSKNYEHLFEQLENRVHHLNRTASKSSLRKKIFSDCDKNEAKIQRPKSLRAEHGCQLWQPTHYPEGETEESQQEKKLWLKLQKSLNSEDAKIADFMLITYASQRIDINASNLNVSNLFLDWPYLSDRQYFFLHANSLMKFDVEERWKCQMEKKVPLLISFFRTTLKGTRYLRINHALHVVEEKVNQLKSKVPEECAIIHLLIKYFAEKEDLILQYFEKTTPLEDVISKLNARVYPVMAILGDSIFENPQTFVLIEGHNIGNAANFKDQIVTFFFLYYVLNFQYPQEIEATLEFIQRCILNIDPVEGGHKRGGKRKRTSVHPLVLSLADKLIAYKSIWSNCEEDDC